MVGFEGARIIEANELKEMLDEEYSNPTIERLMFIEAKAMGGSTKVFPCYVAAWAEEEVKGPVAKVPIIFLAYITQSINGEFGLVQVQIHENELNVTKRIWDKPPTKGLREETPWVAVEAGVQ